MKNQNEITNVRKLEHIQSGFTGYISKPGKWFLYILPVVLVVITLLTLLSIVSIATLSLLFYAVLVVYGINSVILFLGAELTKKSLKKRLEYERKRGRPIDSLDGFELLAANVYRELRLLRIIVIICMVSLIFFVLMLFMNIVELGFAAIGFTLIGLGLGLLIRSLNLNIHDVNGLQDFYIPNTHQIFLDNFFAEAFSNHLDPVTFLKWDEYLAGIKKILNPLFTFKTKKQKPEDTPFTFAVEKILFLYYLKYQQVITEQTFIRELKEVITIETDVFHIDKGLKIDGEWYFSRRDIYKIFTYMKKYNPGFFRIIDRLQLELADNIERMSGESIYMDSTKQEMVYLNGELNLMVFLYNNSPEPEHYFLKIITPGFEPGEVNLHMIVEGRGAFVIPDKSIPLTADVNETDICGVLSTMLENGDTVWLTLEPRVTGTQSIQIRLEREDGTLVKGKIKTVKVMKNMKSRAKKITSVGSLLLGLAVPLTKIFVEFILK